MIENKIKVSVVVPVYNVEPYIRQCLDSLVNQSLTDIEIIIVDDGSPDNCPQIIDEYAAKDRRIKPIHKKNGGVSAARNDGIDAVSGEYVYFADSDDWLETDALEVIYSTAKRDDSDVVVCDYHRAYSGGKITKVTTFPKDFTTKNRKSIDVIQKAIFCNGYSKFHADEFQACRGLAAPWHQLVKADLIKNNRIRFNSDVKGMFDDGLFSLEVYEHARIVSYVQKVCYNYRIVEGSLTNGFNPSVLEKYLLALHAIDEFILRFNKDQEFKKTSMIRRFVYLNLSVDNYFQNTKNQKSEKERYKEFLEYSRKEPFVCMYGSLDPSMVGLKRSSFLAALVNRKQFKLYWTIKRISR